MSVADVVFAAFLPGCGQTAIGLALSLPSVLMLLLFPRQNKFGPAVVIAITIDFAGLNMAALIWMGMPAHTAAWWCALAADVRRPPGGRGETTIGVGGLWRCAVHLDQRQHGWLARWTRFEDNPVELMQLGFVMIVLAFWPDRSFRL